jgi:hypothetical protein
MPVKRVHLESNRSPSRDRLSGQDSLAVKPCDPEDAVTVGGDPDASQR